MLELEQRTKDKAYRRYASGVERALSLFDTALQEWADYISFLGRLFKALQAHPPKVNSIPMSAMVAKRLAQCLDPSLPSGVHQKALDVYAYVFDLIGTDHLSDYLPIYLPGLSPTLSFASLSVRPAFLSLLENQVLRVRPSALRPALRAIILTLLPGLEEETSEEFERTLRLLEGFKEAVKTRGDPDIPSENGAGDEYFWQCFFLASVTSPSRRQGALAFLVRRLPKLSGPINRRRSEPTEDDVLEHQDQGRLPASVEAVVAPEPGLLVRCFAAGLSDDQLLIQRGFLDLLLTHLPLHCTVLQTRVTADDRERLMTAAVGVVARKDMGLNRRL
ncbi:MAG: Endosome to Golgi transport protein, partial [Thelocarpon superellum]